jgi:hypothetical protein
MANEEKQQQEGPRVQSDEDWKKAVAEEKERLHQQQTAGKQTGEPRPPLPEPDMRVFMAGLYTQTLMCLGEIEHPATGKREKNLPEAQFLIDTIAMLEAKTAGNLTPDEGAYVENVLYDLRMRFVSATTGEGTPGEGEEAAPQQ